MRILFGARADYLEEYYDAVADKYGSMDGLIREGFGIDEREKKRLKEKFT